MSKIIIGLVFTFLVVGITNANDILITDDSNITRNYTLFWNDEFNGTSIDTTKWAHRGIGARKLGYTTAEAITVSDGTLKNTIYRDGNKTCSGMIGTQGKFETKFGYFETRAKLPNIKGPQSAFWLQSPKFGSIIGNPQDSGVEVDIIEYVKTKIDTAFFTAHWDGYGKYAKKDGIGIKYPSINDGQWHTYGLLWTADKYSYYLDGKLMHTKTAPVPISQTNEYIILSAEIGLWGGGDNMSSEILPASFEVDYVRVYKVQ